MANQTKQSVERNLNHEGETFLQLREYDEAVRCFTKALSARSTAWSYAHRGEAKRLMGDYSDAQEDFDKAIELDSSYAWAWAHRGEAKRQMGGQDNKEAARKDFDQAITLNPSYAWAVAHRGATFDLDQNSDLPDALQDFEQAINLYSGYAWAYAFRSIVHLRMGEGEKAWYDLLKAISLDNTIIGDTLLAVLLGEQWKH
jgi:tetratricopeptide (TPR) repeat protein